jgi:hypothetical protein
MQNNNYYHRQPNRVKMGVLDAFKKNARKAKLRADIVLIDREITTHKHNFGIELYDALVEYERLHKKLPNKYESVTTEFEQCRRDVTMHGNSIDAKQLEIERHFVTRERIAPAIEMSQKAKNLGTSLSSQSNQVKLQAQIKLLERDIQNRKGAFGIAVADALLLSNTTTESNTSASSKISALTGNPTKQLDQVVTKYQRSIEVSQAQKNIKLREIDALEDGTL